MYVTAPIVGSILDELVSGTDVKGFPIVSADSRNTLMGYVEKNELRYVIGSLFRLCSTNEPTSEALIPALRRQS